MSFESIINGIGDFLKDSARDYERKAMDFLRKKSNQEILALYRKMDRSNANYQYVVREAQRRHLI